MLVSISGEKNRFRLLESVRKLEKMGFELYATEHTSEFLSSHDIWNKRVYKARRTDRKNVLDLIDQKKIDFLINIPGAWEREKMTDGYMLRRKAVDYAIPLINDVQIAKLFIDSISFMPELKIKSWEEYK